MKNLFLFFAAMLVMLSVARVEAQQPPEAFHWVDFHSEEDAEVVNWVRHALAGEKWTTIREIGVEYDAALVLTELRRGPRAVPNTDTFSLWSVSLTSHALTPIVSGANAKFAEWMRFTAGRAPELTLLYDDCEHCQATTFFTALHYDSEQHAFAARWMRNGQAAPLWSTNTLTDGSWIQMYGIFPRLDGSVQLGTWNHFDDPTHKPQQDFLYLYSVDVGSGLESAALLEGKNADDMKKRLCRVEGLLPNMYRGQDPEMCARLQRAEPHPIVTPPANNHGKSFTNK